MPYQARALMQRVQPDAASWRAGHADILVKLYRVWWECDASLAEINPLVVTPRPAR